MTHRKNRVALTKMQTRRRNLAGGFRLLGALRLSFIAPVPHRADERIGQS